MADTKISGLTTDTAPHRTNDYAATYDASAVANKKVALKEFGVIPLYGGFAAFNPADSTTYYFGPFFNLVPTSTSTAYIWSIHRAGLITRATIRLLGGSGTTETSTLYLRINDTTDSTITSTFATNSSTTTTVTGLSIAVAQGDYCTIKWVSPAWATNPTGIYAFVTLFQE